MIQQPLRYEASGKVFEGIYSAPAASDSGAVPGILLAPNLWGPSAYWEEYSAHYVALGYAVLVVDIYGMDVRPQTYEEAQPIVAQMKRQPSQVRPVVAAAHTALAQCPEVDSARIGAAGYCIGGMAVLELGRNANELAGITTFHGHLATDLKADPGTLKASILALHGAEAPTIPDNMVAEFVTEMRSAQADWQQVQFGSQVHAFTDSNASKPGLACYDEKTDRRSWRMMTNFFEEVLATD